MTKCHATQSFKELAMSVLMDVHSLVPTTSQEADRDSNRLLSLIENRGIGFLTLTLPAAGKLLDSALASGRISKLALPGFAPIGGKVSPVIPKFLSGLWMRVFDSDGLLCEDPCISSIAGLRQFLNCFKKARFDCDPKRITSTVDDFYRIDASLRSPSLDWDGGRIDGRIGSHLHLGDESAKYDDFDWYLSGLGQGVPVESSVLLRTIQQSMDCLASTLGEFIAEDWRPKHGTGAVSDARVGHSFKYEFPTWPERLENVFPMADFGFPNYSMWIDWVRGRDDNSYSSFEDKALPSRLITVPKTMKGPRLIASEPTSLQFCQQAILRYLVDRTRTSPLGKALSFNDQSHNQRLALSASRDQEHATIDLSSASDCVSKWLVERMFRSNLSLLEGLIAVRAPSILDEISQPKRLTYLNKYTTMGAATTFPIQSVIYASVAAGVIAYMDGTETSVEKLKSILSRVRVFGDDIIIPTRYARTYIQVLNYLGFEVNSSKTFMDGKFRESCGVDAYDGVDVTPTYILEVYDELRPSSVESVREVSNNLHTAFWWRTADTLLKTLPHKWHRLLPVVGNGTGFPGLTSFCGSDVSSLRKRWNDGYQRFEYSVACVLSKTTRVRSKGSACLLQYFTEEPDPDSMVTWSSGYDKRPRLIVRSRWVEESALTG